jgi:hypothetical protein
MVPVERPKTNEKFASRVKIRKWKTACLYEAASGLPGDKGEET